MCKFEYCLFIEQKEQQEKVDNLTAQLVTAEELVEDRNCTIEQLKAENAQLKDEVSALQITLGTEKTKV